MNFKGTVSQWNDDRGFGFITPVAGGQDIFVHVKAFEGQTNRPAIGQSVSFEVETGKDGKKRAKRVLPAHFAAPYKPQRYVETPKFDAFGLLAIAVFVIFYGYAAIVWRVPHWVGGLYLVASIICFLAQQLLRHESSKASYQSAFWASVIVNVVAFTVFVAAVVGRNALQGLNS